jgi:hypothetical protein
MVPGARARARDGLVQQRRRPGHGHRLDRRAVDGGEMGLADDVYRDWRPRLLWVPFWLATYRSLPRRRRSPVRSASTTASAGGRSWTQADPGTRSRNRSAIRSGGSTCSGCPAFERSFTSAERT